MNIESILETLRESLAQSKLLMNISLEYIIICMGASLICAAVIYCIYRFFYRGTCYSENFNVLNVMTTLVTTLIILTISSNIVLSLGMVGALSIVRFRAAIKDPLDIGFLFWAISAGLTCGAGLYLFAIVGSIFIAFVYVALILVSGSANTYLLVVSFDSNISSQVDENLKDVRKQLKSRVESNGIIELTYKVKTTPKSNLTQRLSKLEGVRKAMLVEFISGN